MQTLENDPDFVENLGIAYSDNYARSREWEYEGLLEPKEDLAMFFKHMPGTRVLDVGCGWARYAHRFFDAGLDYIGIDHSPEMIKVAQGEHPDARFEVMSYRRLEFPVRAFDALWCCCVFGSEPKHNMPTVLESLKRVLIPGGIMMVVLPAVYESQEDLAYDDDGEPVLFHAFYDLDELVTLLEGSGFSTINATNHWQHGAMSVLVRK